MDFLGAFKALWNSEKAVAGGMLIIAATVLAALGDMDIATWTSYTKWIFGLYVAGKTTQGAVAALTGSASPAPTPEPVPASTETPEATVVATEDGPKPVGLLASRKPHGPTKVTAPTKKGK